MNTASTPPVYTPLETLFLIQCIPEYGFDPGSFTQISQVLISNAIISRDPAFDATRLAPAPLQELFLQLLRDELDADQAYVNGNASKSHSPNSKKRKIASPRLANLKDVRHYLHKLVDLDRRLYDRYQQSVVKSVLEDEAQILQLQREIKDLETQEKEETAQRDKIKASAAKGADAIGSSQKAAPPPTPAQPPKLSTAIAQEPPKLPIAPVTEVGTAGGDAQKKGPFATAPQQALLGAQEPARPQAHILPAHPNIRPAVPASPGLQPPPGVHPFPPPAPTSASRPSQPASSQLPEASKSRISPHLPIAPLPGTLKWEPPYNPTQHVQRAPPHMPPQTHESAQVGAQEQLNQSSAPHQVTHGAQPQLAKSPDSLQMPSQQVLNAVSTSGATEPTNRTGASPRPEPKGLADASLPGPSGAPISAAKARLSPAQVPGNAPPLLPAQSRSPQATSPALQPLVTKPQQGPLPQQQQPSHSVGGMPAAQDQQVPQPLKSQRRPQVPLQQASPNAPRAPMAGHALPPSTAHSAVSTPTAKPRHISILPNTPLNTVVHPLLSGPSGSGTRWKLSMTSPSTPRHYLLNEQSPAYEPLSPPLAPAQIPTVSSQPTPKKQTPRSVEKIDTSGSRRKGGRQLATGPKVQQARRASSIPQSEEQKVAETPQIKNEELTPRPRDVAMPDSEDGAADEQGPVTPVSKNKTAKRKRVESETPLSSKQPSHSTPPSHVLWTRGFPKISVSALDQISGHKDANMFAHKIRDRDAPGYSSIIRHPVDLKSIKTAISQGNKAAIAAANNLEGGDPGTSNLWLPISEELVPPRGIINSSHLECELVHMFANAIMYNPDSNRGPGPAFMVRQTPEDEDANVLGYQVDEDGVVKNTRAMYVEVEKVLSEMRAAEQRSPPLPPGATGTGGVLGRQASVTGGSGDDLPTIENDVEDSATTEAEGTGAAKRRRITRG